MNVEIGAEAAQFPEKEYIKGIALAVCENSDKIPKIKTSTYILHLSAWVWVYHLPVPVGWRGISYLFK
jgi:hypothetical protein